jgi:DNA-3-methyladenine glycosylase
MPNDPVGALLTQRFFARDALDLARDLVGRVLVRGEVAVRITEVEAYRHPGDTASHCRMGRTARNAPMWGPPGHAYVYLCYGVHSMLNLVSNAEGEGAAVLVRAAEAIAGEAVIAGRRGGRLDLAGPGKVAAALALDTSWSGHPLFVRGGLELHEGTPVPRALVGPRVGIDYAAARDRRAPYRFADPGSSSVTVRRTLSLERKSHERRTA